MARVIVDGASDVAMDVAMDATLDAVLDASRMDLLFEHRSKAMDVQTAVCDCDYCKTAF